MNLEMRKRKLENSFGEQFEEKIHNHWRFSGGSPMTLRRGQNFNSGTLPVNVSVQLNNKKLWEQFHAQTTEMIITKLGRRMFPAIQVSVNGLSANMKYHVLLEILPASQRRHKYIGNCEKFGNHEIKRKNSGWTVAGNSEAQSPIHKRLYLHPDSPATGKHWEQQPISFAKLKLTNNTVDHHNNIVLTSMHKYIPIIWIIQSDSLGSISNIYHQPSACFYFEETEFIAVTAYQNENITKLKIDNNPFAKGFRETGHYRCKRKYEENLDNSQEDEPHTPETPEVNEKIENNEIIDIDDSNSENVGSKCPVRLYRPWTVSAPPKAHDQHHALFPPPQIPPNFTFFPHLSHFPFSHFQIGSNFQQNQIFPLQKFY